MEKQTFASTSNMTPPALALHNHSQTISKATKPKIRIIHVFAPEIIKTDAENFRELVQRLTGKPTNRKKPRKIPSNKNPRILPMAPNTAELAIRSGFNAPGFRERIKGEEEIWRSANSGGGFLSGLSEFEGFMQEVNQFQLEGLQMDAYGESQLA